ncbi:ABC transporter substrate-binding protein [Magnetospira thiophila]
MIWLKGLTRGFLIVVLLGGAASVQAEEPKEAQQVVADFQATLLSVMKQSSSMGVQGRYDLLAPALSQAFHLPLMVQVATAESWDQATPDQQKRLIAAFHRMSAATVATLFDGYSNENFRITGERPGPGGTLLVDTVLESPSGDGHQISYVSKKVGPEWRLVDVVVDHGISELSVRRSEYRRTLERDGIEGLISALDSKATDLLNR